MRALFATATLIAALGAAPVYGVIGADPPANACPPEMAKFKLNLGVLNVNGDGSLGAGACANAVLSETVITCTSKEKAGKPMDIAIEYFDSSGATISSSPLVVGTNLFCGVGPGETVTFHTVPPGSVLPTPWGGTGAFPGFVFTTAAPEPIASCAYSTAGCFLHGSARVLATSTKLHCTATQLDLLGPCIGDVNGVLTSKELTIIKKVKQQGD